jgi:hypothetical protein
MFTRESVLKKFISLLFIFNLTVIPTSQSGIILIGYTNYKFWKNEKNIGPLGVFGTFIGISFLANGLLGILAHDGNGRLPYAILDEPVKNYSDILPYFEKKIPHFSKIENQEIKDEIMLTLFESDPIETEYGLYYTMDEESLFDLLELTDLTEVDKTEMSQFLIK